MDDWIKEVEAQHKRYLANQKQVEREHNDVVYFLLRHSKRRAKRKGIEWNLTRGDFTVPTHCPIMGVPLVKHKGQFDRNSPSLDRIVNSQGYVPGNVKVISW